MLSRGNDGASGVVLADALFAAAILGAVGAAMAASLSMGRLASERAQAHNQLSGCFDETLVRLSADEDLVSGRCGEVDWVIRGSKESRRWVGTSRLGYEQEIPLPPAR